MKRANLKQLSDDIDLLVASLKYDSDCFKEYGNYQDVARCSEILSQARTLRDSIDDLLAISNPKPATVTRTKLPLHFTQTLTFTKH